VQPDLMFISNERAAIVQDRVRGGPDLVVEVLSPNPRIGRTAERVEWFAKYGVRECWLVDHARRDVTVLGFADGSIDRRRVFARQQGIESSVVPEFTQALDDILDD
jgi:Uma2 family endonuclease